MKLLIPEILLQVNNAKTESEKIALLKQHESPVIKGLMRINFDMNVKMDLPPGIPPYNIVQRPIGIEHNILNIEYRKFYIWLSPNNLTKTRKEHLFIQMLEGLHPTEADLLCLVKDRKLTERYPNITEDLIRKVYIGTLPPLEVQTEVKEEVEQKVEIKPEQEQAPRRRGRPRKQA